MPSAAGEALTALGISFTTVTRDTNIIAQVLPLMYLFFCFTVPCAFSCTMLFPTSS